MDAAAAARRETESSYHRAAAELMARMLECEGHAVPGLDAVLLQQQAYMAAMEL
jgi:hypothetical protein